MRKNPACCEETEISSKRFSLASLRGHIVRRFWDGTDLFGGVGYPEPLDPCASLSSRIGIVSWSTFSDLQGTAQEWSFGG